MNQFNEKLIDSDGAPFIIAEVGNNHQGQLPLALEYIKQFASRGASAIKFQVRDNKRLFAVCAYNKVYNSEQSFGQTYGEHREFLELSSVDLETLRDACHEVGVAFMATPFDEPSIDLLEKIGVDVIKLASFDSGNLPFVKLAATVGSPVVMSVGGSSDTHIEDSIAVLEGADIHYSILHCVSKYPCEPEDLRLGRIVELKEKYPGIKIGLSDHFNGILSGSLARSVGAEIFEKHVTLNRSWKGTDHGFALEPEGFRRFVRDIHRVDQMMNFGLNSDVGSEPVFKKLGKTIVYNKSLPVGHVVTIDDLSGKIFDVMGGGRPVRDSGLYINQRLAKSVIEGQKLQESDFN